MPPQSITEENGNTRIDAKSKVTVTPNLTVTQGENYYQKGYYYQHFDISGLGTNAEIIAGTKNTIIFWLSDSTEIVTEDIANPTYIADFNSGFQVGWWLTGVNDGRFPTRSNCHFEITEIDANKITVKFIASAGTFEWWIDSWLRNGKVDLTGNYSTDDYSVYCNGANTDNILQKLAQTQIGLVTLSANSFMVGGVNFFGSSKNITIGKSNFTTLGNTLTAGANLINTSYNQTVVGHDNENISAAFQVGSGGNSNSRKTSFYITESAINTKLPIVGTENIIIKKADGSNCFITSVENGYIGVNGTTFITALKDNDSNKVLMADKNTGEIVKSNVTANELGYLSGVTSNIQSQINDISEGKGAYKNVVTLSTGQIETNLDWSGDTNTFIPTSDISDVSIKIMALNAAKTNIEKYNVKFMAYKNDDEIIATNPLCESVVSNGIQLIDSVDVKLNAEKTGIEVAVKTKQEKVTLRYSISISQF